MRELGYLVTFLGVDGRRGAGLLTWNGRRFGGRNIGCLLEKRRVWRRITFGEIGRCRGSRVGSSGWQRSRDRGWKRGQNLARLGIDEVDVEELGRGRNPAQLSWEAFFFKPARSRRSKVSIGLRWDEWEWAGSRRTIPTSQHERVVRRQSCCPGCLDRKWRQR